MSDEGDPPTDDDNPFEVTESDDSPETTTPKTGGIATSDDEDGDGSTEFDGTDDEESDESSGFDGADDEEEETDDLADREAELDKREDRLDQREDGLDVRAEKLKARADELDDREADLETERQELDTWRSDLEARKAQLDQREQDLDDREAAIQERESELEAWEAELDEHEQTLHTYVGSNLADVESAITETVREAVSSAAERIDPGPAEVDQESLNESVESAIADAMDDYSQSSGRFGIAGNVLLGLTGLVFVVGGATVLFSTQTDAIPRAFDGVGLNYGAAAVLVFIGLAVNLSAAADRL